MLLLSDEWCVIELGCVSDGGEYSRRSVALRCPEQPSVSAAYSSGLAAVRSPHDLR